MKCCGSFKKKVFPETDVAHGPELRAKELKAVGDKMARDIVISHFKTLFRENKNVTLDQAILSFENAGTEFDNLADFAKSKTRTPEMYRASYEQLFIAAKEKPFDNNLN